MPSDQLKPCPFCASKDVGTFETYEGQEKPYAIDCGDCYAVGPPQSTPELAAIAWNTRDAQENANG